MAERSIIGQGSVVRGNVSGRGSLEILGRVEGDVSVDGDVHIGEHGAVQGSVSGAEIRVGGAVEGDLTGSEAVLMTASARVVGDLNAPRIGIAEGALVRGSVRTDGSPDLGGSRRRAAAEAAPPRKREAARAEAPKAEPAPRQKAAAKKPPPPVVPALKKGRARKKSRRR